MADEETWHMEIRQQKAEGLNRHSTEQSLA
jgi:hypothetical protein